MTAATILRSRDQSTALRSSPANPWECDNAGTVKSQDFSGHPSGGLSRLALSLECTGAHTLKATHNHQRSELELLSDTSSITYCTSYLQGL